MTANTTITLDEFYAAVVADIRAAFPFFVTVEFDREDRAEVPLPALLLEIPSFDSADDIDPGTGEWACSARIEARLMFAFRDEQVKLKCRKVATALAAWLRSRRFQRVGAPAGEKLPTGPAQVLTAERDDFDPTLDKFDVWRVDWLQVMHFGENVWAEGEFIEQAAFVGFAPEIGSLHENKYTQVQAAGENQ